MFSTYPLLPPFLGVYQSTYGSQRSPKRVELDAARMDARKAGKRAAIEKRSRDEYKTQRTTEQKNAWLQGYDCVYEGTLYAAKMAKLVA